ncbi:MAG: OmpA family protein [Mariprofundaceae bacterium]
MIVLHAETVTAESVQAQLQKFVQSRDHRFAPATAARAQSFLDAARATTYEVGQEAVADHLRTSAKRTVVEAKQLAHSFQKKNSDLLALVNTIKGLVDAVDPMMTQIESTLDKAVSSMEKGSLNALSQDLEQLRMLCMMAFDEQLPNLILKTGQTIAKASASGAKEYAPVYYNAAKAEQERLKSYRPESGTMPPMPPDRAVKLAERAYKMGGQVRIWRKQGNSFSSQFHDTRMLKLRIAQSLGLTVNNVYDPLADVGEAALLRAAEQLRKQLEDLKAEHASEVAHLKSKYTQSTQTQADAIRNEYQQKQSKQVNDLKEAFRAKLEKETFEKRRAKRLRKVFKSSKVEVMLHADGSILIRLAQLHFSSGSSSLERKYYPLLNQLQQAIKLYHDRAIRIEGHTDNTGDAKKNQRLSLQRAESVRDFLLATDAKQSSIKAMGYGVAKPIASNDYEKGRTMNRRIDVVIEAKTR